MKRFKVGVVQSTPVFFDLEATLEKTEAIVAEQDYIFFDLYWIALNEDFN